MARVWTYLIRGLKITTLLLSMTLLATLLYAVIIPLAQSGKPRSTAYIPHPVIAHRGASYLAPEETEPAYILARDLGADYLEMDIQRTKDHQLVAFHDDTLARTTNVALVFPGREKDQLQAFTLAELKQLDAGSWYNKKYPDRARPAYNGLHILTLDEVITIAESGNGKRPALYIETKSPWHHPRFEDELVTVLRQRGWLDYDPAKGPAPVVFQSFGLDSLKRLKELAPQLPRVYLLAYEMKKEQGWDTLIRDAAEVGNGIGPVGFLGLPRYNAKAHALGLAIHLYTLDERWQYRVFTWMGADGFFTDRCELALEFYGRTPPETPATILHRHGF